MKGIVSRIILAAAGIAIALSGLWGGAEMHVWAVGAYEGGDGMSPLIVLTVLSTVAAILGAVMFCLWIAFLIDGNEAAGDSPEIMSSSLGAICLCFLLGSIGVGTEALSRLTPWVFLLIAAFLPMLFVVWAMLVEIWSSITARIKRN